MAEEPDFKMKRLALDMLNIKIWVDGLNVEIIQNGLLLLG